MTKSFTALLDIGAAYERQYPGTNQLKLSPFIADAVVIGDRRKYLTCLVMLDADTVAQHAQDHSIPFTNYASLCRAQPIR